MTTLDQICLNIVDCEHKTAPIQDIGIPSIRTTDIKGGVIDFRGANKVSEETYKGWIQRLEPQPQDLILAREAPVGEVGIIPKGQRACLGQRTVLIRSNPDKVYPHYLLYLMLSREVQHEMQIRVAGSTVEHLNMSDIRELKLPKLPSLEVQCQIGDTLANLDRKISNLRKQNETLEAIAQTLFKHWFVDFEFPNEDGKPYKSSGGEMVRSELGEIPVGWRVGKLEDICKIINGFAFKSQDYRDDGVKIIRTKNFSEAGFIEPNDLVFISKAQLDKYSGFELRKFDFLMVMVGASIGKFVVTTSHILPALQNQNMWNFRSIIQEDQMFLNYSLKILISQHSNSATGSAREFFRKDYFYKISIVLPDDEIIKAFSIFCLRLASKVDLNIRQIQSLTKARDVLLPKLMSGKLRITAS